MRQSGIDDTLIEMGRKFTGKTSVWQSCCLTFLAGAFACSHQVHRALEESAFRVARVPQSHYVSGRDLCEPHSDPFVREQGRFAEVPVDYDDSSRGKTPIYFYFPKTFDPLKPTFAFFTGGPGQSSHLLDIPAARFLIDLPFNLLLMDQRGIACSAAQTESLSRSPDFYSSERVARDLNEIRLALGITQLSIYGASYGTVPATIFANLFPQATRAVVLEGTVYTGFELMFKVDSSVLHLGQKLYDNLDPETRTRFRKHLFSLSEDGTGFGDFVRAILRANGKAGLNEAVEVITVAMKSNQSDRINDWFFSQGNSPKDMYYNDAVNRILFCKEFGATQRNVSMVQRLNENGRVEDVPNSNDYASISCPQFGFTKETASTFVAADFPVSPPITYFQGGGDSATIPLGFSKHFKSVPRGKRAAWILVDGGHMPTQQVYRSGDSLRMEAIRRVFIAALSGEPPLPADVVTLTDKGNPLRWAFSSKQ